jgi:hypothetical protein
VQAVRVYMVEIRIVANIFFFILCCSLFAINFDLYS